MNFETVPLNLNPKQLCTGVLQIGVLKEFHNIHTKTPVLEFLFVKVADLQTVSLMKRDSGTGFSL